MHNPFAIMRPAPHVAYERLVRRFADRMPANQAAADDVRRRLPDAVALLTSHFGARRVILFGSLSRGLFDYERSDVDLAVEGLGIGALSTAGEQVSEILGRRVDLIGLEDASPELRSQIDRGELLYGA